MKKLHLPEIAVNKKVVIFKDLKEAQLKTGYFSVSTIMIRTNLADRIETFIHERRLSTFSQNNQAKTAACIYTLNFTLKKYFEGSKAYISSPGALGYYKHTLQTRSYTMNPETPKEYVAVHPPSKESIETLTALRERTPSMMDIYFWIARKYPTDILWMDYRTEEPVGTTFGQRFSSI